MIKFKTQLMDYERNFAIGIDNGLPGKSRYRNAIYLYCKKPSIKKLIKAKRLLKQGLIKSRSRVK